MYVHIFIVSMWYRARLCCSANAIELYENSCNMLYSNPLLTSFPYLSTISFCSDGVFLEIEAISDAVMPPRFNADVAGIASRYMQIAYIHTPRFHYYHLVDGT